MNESLSFLIWNEPGKALQIKAIIDRGTAQAEFETLKENAKLESVKLYGPITPSASWNPLEVAGIVEAANKARIAAEAAEKEAARLAAEAALEKAEADLKSAKETLKKFSK